MLLDDYAYADITSDNVSSIAAGMVSESRGWLTAVRATDTRGLMALEALAVVDAMEKARFYIESNVSQSSVYGMGRGWVSYPLLDALYPFLERAFKRSVFLSDDVGGAASSGDYDYRTALIELRHWWERVYNTDYPYRSVHDYAGVVDADVYSYLMLDMKARADALVFLAKSDIWVKSIDRSRLGVLATPPNILALGHAIHRTSKNRSRYRVKELLEYMLTTETGQSVFGSPEFDNELSAEVWFWNKPGKRTPRFRLKAPLLPAVVRLETIAANPEMHDYFAAGIWDIEFINRCLAEGIDASIAVEMFPRENGSYAV